MKTATQRFARLLPIAATVAAWAMAGTALAQGVLVPQAPAAPPQDTLTRAATSVGIKRCLPAITRLATLTVQGSRGHDVLLDWDRKRPDDGPMFSLVGIQYPNAGVAASITAIPGDSGTCTVSAERISVAPFTCQSVAEQELGLPDDAPAPHLCGLHRSQGADLVGLADRFAAGLPRDPPLCRIRLARSVDARSRIGACGCSGRAGAQAPLAGTLADGRGASASDTRDRP